MILKVIIFCLQINPWKKWFNSFHFLWYGLSYSSSVHVYVIHKNCLLKEFYFDSFMRGLLNDLEIRFYLMVDVHIFANYYLIGWAKFKSNFEIAFLCISCKTKFGFYLGYLDFSSHAIQRKFLWYVEIV